MFFYNSTTLFHFPKTATPVAGLNRKVNLILDRIQKGFGMAWDVTKTTARIASKPFKLALMTKPAGAVIGATWAGAKAGLNAVETAEYTAAEIAAGTFNATVAPMAIWGFSSLESMWIKFRYLSMDILKAAVKTPIALAKSPLELARGVRDSIVSIPRNLAEVAGNIFKLNLKDTIASTRKFVKEAFLPPIVRPLAPVVAPTKTAVSTLVRSELVKLLAVKDGFKHAAGGVKQVINSFGTARQKVALLNAERDLRALEREKEKQEAAKKAEESLKKGHEAKGEKKGK